MNVLTIDIDYAFSPHISLYDDYVEGSRITYENQRKILSNKGFAEPKINQEKFNKLVEIFKYFSTDKNFECVDHHHEILKYLTSSNNFRIQNIDHHHDIYYPGWHCLNVLDEGNWVYHLSKEKKIESYEWFRNKDSEDFSSTIQLNFNFLQTNDLELKMINPPDIIVLCSSPHWTFDTNNLLIKKLIGE